MSKIFSSENDLPAPHFVAAKRIDANNYNSKSLSSFIRKYCEQNGEPLVVSNIDQLKNWNDQAFTLDQLSKFRGDADVDLVYPNPDKKTVKLGLVINSLKHKYNLGGDTQPSNSFNVNNFYAKDISCPDEFKQAMYKALPKYLLPHSYSDLFAFLPQRFQAENLMCYVGHCNTGTPIHRDLCGTMGHNIMITSSPDAFAEWYIVQNNQREELASILKPTSKKDKRIHMIDNIDTNTKSSFLESDRAWLDHEKLQNHNLKVQVIIQRKGDLVIVPSRAYHQVRNSGVSVKIAWNRITADTLNYAFEDQLPLYRIINRPEVYKCKAIVAFTLKEWYNQMMSVDDIVNKKIGESVSMPSAFRSGVPEFVRNSKTLLNIYLNEVIAPELLYEEHNQNIVTDGPGEICTIVCDFCHSDIFHRYYHCKACNKYDICLNCYSMGRSCKHTAAMKMHQSPEDIMTHVELYRLFVLALNTKFGDALGQIEPGLEQKLLNIPLAEAGNLATTCRRIEAYRSLKRFSFNTLKCSHCASRTTLAKLCDEGYGLSSVFSRAACPSVPLLDFREGTLQIFSCPKCTRRCKSCKPLVNDKASLNNYDLVYYLHPSYDQRNYGGYIDKNLPKTCDFPFRKSPVVAPSPPSPSSTPSPPSQPSLPTPPPSSMPLLSSPLLDEQEKMSLRKRKNIDYRALAGLTDKQGPKRRKSEEPVVVGATTWKKITLRPPLTPSMKRKRRGVSL